MQSRPFTEPGANPARFTFTPTTATDGILHHPDAQPRTLARTIARTIEGVDLVAHFPVGGIGWLIVTDCDCPFEEIVYLHLLGPTLRPLETTTLGGAYTPGIVGGMERLEPRRFRILFPSLDQPQIVTIEPRRRGLLRRTIWFTITAER